MSVKYREHNSTDLNFIFATLLKSYRYSNPQARTIPPWDYYKHGSREWQLCLEKGAKIVVACDESDEELIVGFMIYTKNVLHYIYVKAAFRRAGIAKDMFAKIRADYFTHWTVDGGNILDAKPMSLIYNPYPFTWLGYVEHKGDRDERANRSN